MARTQLERRTTTRTRLLDATIDALVELGYAATTTTVIADRAGVSRGAQQNHYRTKAELVAAAIEHLAGKLIARVRSDFSAQPPDADRIAFTVDALWSAYSHPLLLAWIELSVAARTDPELRAALAPMEARVRGEVVSTVQASVGDDLPQALLLLSMTGCLFEGMTIERSVADLAPHMVEMWKRMLASVS
jgi:AcrR family transcriptional regulator